MESFAQFNESVRDKMTPKSEEDIESSIDNLSPNEKLIKGSKYGLLWLVKQAIELGAGKDIHTIELALLNARYYKHIDVADYLVTKNDELRQQLSLKLKHQMKTNESVRNLMTPKSKDEIKNNLISASLFNKLEMMEKHKYDKEQTYNKLFKKYFTEDVLKKDAEKESSDTKTFLGWRYKVPWLLELGIIEGGDLSTIGKDIMRTVSLEGFTNVVKLLLDKGVSANSKNALSCAVEKGHIDIVKMLLEAGANPHQDNNYPFSCSSGSHVQNSLDIFDLLTKYAVKDISSYSKTANSRRAREKANESIKDLMTGKSREAVMKSLEGLTPFDKITAIYSQQMADMFTDDELRGFIDKIPSQYRLKTIETYSFHQLYTENELNQMRIDYLNNNDLDVEKIRGVMFDLLFNSFDVDVVKFLDFIEKKFYKQPFPHGYINPNYSLMLATVLDRMDKKQLMRFFKLIVKEEVYKNQNTNESVRDLMTPINKSKFDEFVNQFNDHNSKILWGKQGMINMITDNFDTEEIEKKLDEFIDPLDMMVWTSDKGNYGQVYTYDKLNALNKNQLKELFNRLIGNSNESVKDLMTPRPEEDIKKNVKNLLPNLELLKGAEFGFLWAVEDAVKRGADVTCDQRHALAVAIQGGYLDIIKILINKDNLNQLSLDWALTNACRIGHIDIVEFLLKQGADPNIPKHNLYLIPQDKKSEIKFLLKKYGRGYGFDKNRLVTNESIRDKMTPISKQDLKKHYDDIIKNFDPISKDKSLVISWGIQGMLKFMGETRDSMCLVMAGDKYFDALDSFFWSLVENKDKKFESEWMYWKELKLTYSLVPCAMWMFSKDIDYIDKSINESVRDKMTPKSPEEIERIQRMLDDIVYKIMNKYPSLGIFDWKKWGMKVNYELIDAIRNNAYFFIDSKNRGWVINISNGHHLDFRSFPYNSERKKVFKNFKELEDYLETIGFNKIDESLQDSLTGKPIEHITSVGNFHRYNFREDWANHEKYGKDVGYIVIDSKLGELYLSSFTIWGPYKGKGLGRKYLNLILDELKKFDYPWIGLSVKRDNDIAIKLYRSLGFKDESEVEEYDGAGKNYKNKLYYYLIKENK